MARSRTRRYDYQCDDFGGLVQRPKCLCGAARCGGVIGGARVGGTVGAGFFSRAGGGGGDCAERVGGGAAAWAKAAAWDEKAERAVDAADGAGFVLS